MWKKADWGNIKKHMGTACNAVPADMKENRDPNKILKWFKDFLYQADEPLVSHRSAGK